MSMKFVLASNNKKKISELRRIIAELSPSAEILSLSDIGFSGDIVEDGDSFAANAIIKASVPARLGYIGIADDSGICVDALGGAPGIHSARWSGGNDEDNNEKLLYELRDVPDTERGAHYACAVACVFPERYGIEPIVAYGECHGRILREYHGTGGFGYDPLFYRDEEECTFGELSPEDKDRVSHRGAALREFSKLIAPVIEQIVASDGMPEEDKKDKK